MTQRTGAQRPGTPRTVLLVNHWHDDNKGDSAITAATVGLIRERYPDATIRVVGLLEGDGPGDERAFRHLTTAYPDVVTEPAWLPSERSTRDRWPYLGERLGTVAWLARCLPWALSFVTGMVAGPVRRRLSGVDLVVMVGGSNIYDDPAVMAPASLGRLLSVLYVAWAASRAGIPVIGVGHTLGPFPRAWGRKMASRVLSQLQVLGVRDPRSHQLGVEMGLPVLRVPDVAYALPARLSRALDDFCRGLPVPLERSALVLPRQHPSAGPDADGRFLAELASACRRLVDDGVVDQIVVGAHCLGPTAIEDDRRSMDRLLPLLADLPVVCLDADLSPQEQVTLYGRARVALSVRLHGSILAMVGGTPAFTVAYFSTKAEGAMADAGLAHAWTTFAAFEAAAAVATVTGLVDEETRSRVGERVAAVRRDLGGLPQSWPDLRRPVADRLAPGGAVPVSHLPSQWRSA